MTMPYQALIALFIFLAGLGLGMKLTNNARDAELYIAQQAAEELALIRGQEAADIIQEVLDEKQKTKIIYRTKYIDKARAVERTNQCKLHDDSLQLWQEAINNINTQTLGTDAAMPATGSTH